MMEAEDPGEAPANESGFVETGVRNSITTPEIVLEHLPPNESDAHQKRNEFPQITQTETENKENEETVDTEHPGRSKSTLEVLKLDLQEQRRRSVELTEDIQNVERLKAQRERETQEVKKREMMPSFGSILQKKCREIFEEAKDLQRVGDREETLILLTKLILMQAQKSQESNIFAVSEISEPYRMRAEIYLEMCDFQSAILNYKKVCSLLPDEPKHFERLAFMYFFYGQVLFDQGQFPEALECFSRAAEMQPDTVGYHTRSVACLASLQRHGECLALVNRRIEVEADNPDLFVMRARLHQLFGNSTLCYYDVRDALELDPELQQAKELRQALFDKAVQLKDQAVMLLLENKLQEALRKMSQAIDHDPTVAEFHVLRGSINRNDL